MLLQLKTQKAMNRGFDDYNSVPIKTNIRHWLGRIEKVDSKSSADAPLVDDLSEAINRFPIDGRTHPTLIENPWRQKIENTVL
jgi:hypothetical protein